MARKKEENTPAVKGALRSEVMKEMLRVQKAKTGCDNIYPASQAHKFVIGFAMPSIALQYLFDTNIFVLGKVVGVSGKPGSCKSSFGFEVARWFSDRDAHVELKECEGNKVSPSLIESVVGAENMEKIVVGPCSTINQAQEQITLCVKVLKERTDKTLPMLVLIDSLSGTVTAEKWDKIEKEGSVSRGYATEALSWTDYFKKLSVDIAGWPISFMFVNHEKDKINSQGPVPGKNLPGGIAQQFSASTIISMRKQGHSVKAGYSCNHLLMVNTKNSLGADHRKVNVDFQWYFTPEGKQVSLFNWMDADAQLLASEDVQKLEAIRACCPVTCNAKRYSCKPLEISGVMGEELGRKIHEDPALVRKIQDALQIQQYTVYDGSWPKVEE